MLRTALAVALLFLILRPTYAQQYPSESENPGAPGRTLTAEDFAVYRAAIDTVFTGAARVLIADSVAASRVVPDDSLRSRTTDLLALSFAGGRANQTSVPLAPNSLGTSVEVIGVSPSLLLSGPPDAESAGGFTWLMRRFGTDVAGLLSGIWYSSGKEVARMDAVHMSPRGVFFFRVYLAQTPEGWITIGTDWVPTGYGPGDAE